MIFFPCMFFETKPWMAPLVSRVRAACAALLALLSVMQWYHCICPSFTTTFEMRIFLLVTQQCPHTERDTSDHATVTTSHT